MGLARKLEQRLEQLVDGLSAAIFRGGMHPVELAGRVIRQADLATTDGDLGPEVPNVYSVRIHPKDLAAGIDLRALEREIANAVAETAAERGWRTHGPISVSVTTDESVSIGAVDCTATQRQGRMRPWGQLIGARGGDMHDLADNRILVGRAGSSDVVLSQPEVSRRHAMVFRQEGSVWVVDLGSANGTRVNRARVHSDPAQVRPGDELAFASAVYTLRVT